MFESAEVLRVLTLLREAGCEVWVGGGWGIDALLGRVTREHHDLDLMHLAKQEPVVIETLAGLGYRELPGIVPGRPARFVMRDTAGHEIDLHPLTFQPDGSALQPADDQGGTFAYPADCFVEGAVHGARVPCLSAAQQELFHSGYEPRERDLLDLAALRERYGTP
ncbi:nucleotidyltransferase domain-containing protein [Nonomuraea sp. NPDC050790]|uniref:nucleotidyltransferase domain-containing protein n=1 Tax=Nonomuraea sp. NPDC050790 TaxID=3364371 RepID=UPI003797BD49